MVVNACLFVFRPMKSNEFHLHGRSRYKRSNRVRNALARFLSKETQQSHTKFALARRLSFQIQTKRIHTHIYYKRQRFLIISESAFVHLRNVNAKYAFLNATGYFGRRLLMFGTFKNVSRLKLSKHHIWHSGMLQYAWEHDFSSISPCLPWTVLDNDGHWPSLISSQGVRS